MSKLFTLKSWFTLDEAADHIAAAIGNAVTAFDVIQMALDKQVVISVNLLNGMDVRRGKAVPYSDNISGGFPFNEKDLLVFEETIHSISGIFDMPMIGGEILDCQHKMQKIIGGPVVTGGDYRGAFLKSPVSDAYFQRMRLINPPPIDFDFYTARNEPELWHCFPRLFDGFLLESYAKMGGKVQSEPSKEDVFVIRSEALTNFIESINDGSENGYSPEVWRAYVAEVVVKHNGNQTQAAKELGISRARVGQLMTPTVKAERKPLAFSAQDPFGIAKKPASNKRS